MTKTVAGDQKPLQLSDEGACATHCGTDEAVLARSIHSLRSRIYLTEKTIQSLSELERLTTVKPPSPAQLSPCNTMAMEGGMPAALTAIVRGHVTMVTSENQLPPVLTLAELGSGHGFASEPRRAATDETDGAAPRGLLTPRALQTQQQLHGRLLQTLTVASSPPYLETVRSCNGNSGRSKAGDTSVEMVEILVPSESHCKKHDANIVSDLQEKVQGLLSEVEAQEKALLKTERLYEGSQKELAEMTRQCRRYTSLLSQAEVKLQEQTEEIDRLEDERDRTLSQLDELEASLTSHHQRSDNSSEVELLRCQLKECTNEKEKLLQSGYRLTQRVTHLEGELREKETTLTCERKEKNLLKRASSTLLAQVCALAEQVETTGSSSKPGADNSPQSLKRQSPSRAADDTDWERAAASLPPGSADNVEGVEGANFLHNPALLEKLRIDVVRVLAENGQLRARLVESTRRVSDLEAAAAEARAEVDALEEARVRDAADARRRLDSALADADHARMQSIELRCRSDELEQNVEAGRRELATCRRRLEQELSCGASRQTAAHNGFGKTEDGGDATTDASIARDHVADLRMQLNEKDLQIMRLQALHSDSSARPASSLPTTAHKREGKRSSATNAAGGRDSSSAAFASGEEPVALSEALRARLHEQDADLCACRRKLAAAQKRAAEYEKQSASYRSEAHELAKQLAMCQAEHDSLTDELQQKTSFAAALEEQANTAKASVKEKSTALRKLRQLHTEQCRHYTEENNILEQQCTEHKQRGADLQTALTLTKGALADKLLLLQQLEQSVNVLQQTAEQDRERARQTVDSLEVQMREAAERVHEVETALSTCQADLRSCVSKYEAVRAQHEQEASHRTGELDQTEKKLQQVQKLLEVQSSHVCHLQESLDECQRMLETSVARTHELEDHQLSLQEQMDMTEHEAERDRAAAKVVKQQLERALGETHSELDASRAQLSTALAQVRQSKSEQGSLDVKVVSTQREVNRLRKQEQKKDAKLIKLQTELDASQKTAEAKVNELNILEDRLRQMEAAVTEQTVCNSHFDGKLRQAESEVQQTVSQLQELQALLARTRDERDSLEGALHETRLGLRRSQMEVVGKSSELEELQEQLEEQERDLQQRAAQVTRLDVAIREHKAETEKRILCLESSLQDSRAELDRKTVQVRQLEDDVRRLEGALRAKAVELSVAEQHGRKLQQELDRRSAAALDLEQHVDELEEQTSSLRSGALSKAREAIANSEKVQKQEEIMETLEQDLVYSQRSRDDLTRQLRDLEVQHARCLEDKSSLESDLEAMHAQVAAAAQRDMRARVELMTEIEQTQAELERLQHGHRHEIQRLEEAHREILLSKEQMAAEFHLKAPTVENGEGQLRRQLQLSGEQVALLKDELGSRLDMLRATSEAALVKDAEIARLQGKLSSYERQLHAASSTWRQHRDPSPSFELSLSSNSSPVKSFVASPTNNENQQQHAAPPAARLSVSGSFAVTHNGFADRAGRVPVPPTADHATNLIGRLQNVNGKYKHLERIPSGSEDTSVATTTCSSCSSDYRIRGSARRLFAGSSNWMGVANTGDARAKASHGQATAFNFASLNDSSRLGSVAPERAADMSECSSQETVLQANDDLVVS